MHCAAASIEGRPLRRPKKKPRLMTRPRLTKGALLTKETRKQRRGLLRSPVHRRAERSEPRPRKVVPRRPLQRRERQRRLTRNRAAHKKLLKRKAPQRSLLRRNRRQRKQQLKSLPQRRLKHARALKSAV